MIDHMTALIYTMVLVSAADRNMSDAELRTIGEIVRYLPIFKKFDLDKLPKIAADCAEILDDDEGLDKALEVIKGALPQKLHETGYAVACDVAAADGHIEPEVHPPARIAAPRPRRRPAGRRRHRARRPRPPYGAVAASTA